MPISRTLRNMIAAVDGRSFSIEEGEFGDRVVIRSAWSSEIGSYIGRRGIKEIRIIDGPSRTDSVESLEFLAALPPLEGFVSLTHRIKSYRPLSLHSGLRAMNFGYGFSKEGAIQLPFFKSLERLYLGGIIPDERQVFDCCGLQKLAITGFPRGGESTIFSSLSSLTTLRINGAGLKEVEGLSQLSHLETLDLFNMRNLDSLAGVESLVGLRELKLQGCRKIKSIDPLARLCNLEVLWLEDCGEIDSVIPVCELKRLREIFIIGSTTIMDGRLDVLRGLPSLTSVRIAQKANYKI